MINRKIIYFPYINLNPSDPWYKSAILYWDKISILTHEFNKNSIPFEGETKNLFVDHGLIEPLYVRNHLDDHLVVNFIEYVSKFTTKDAAVRCYQGKFSELLVERLKEKGLLVEDGYDYLVEGKTARLYLSLVATKKALLSEYDLYTDDIANYQFLNFGKPINLSKKIVRKDEYVSAVLEEILPVPRDNVSLQDVLEFKNKYQDEYLDFRNFVEKKFESLKDISVMHDDDFLKMKKELREGISDTVMIPLEKEFSKIKKVSIPIIDFYLKFPVLSILNAISEDKKSKSRMLYLGLVEANLS